MREQIKSIEVSWSGHYPALCLGEWAISINGIPLEIPYEVRKRHFDTYGLYSQWFFDENYLEYDEDYFDGVSLPSWVRNNIWWLGPEIERLNLHFTPADWETLYDKIHEQDFRPGSCGGCI